MEIRRPKLESLNDPNDLYQELKCSLHRLSLLPILDIEARKAEHKHATRVHKKYERICKKGMTVAEKDTQDEDIIIRNMSG